MRFELWKPSRSSDPKTLDTSRKEDAQFAILVKNFFIGKGVHERILMMEIKNSK